MYDLFIIVYLSDDYLIVSGCFLTLCRVHFFDFILSFFIFREGGPVGMLSKRKILFPVYPTSMINRWAIGPRAYLPLLPTTRHCIYDMNIQSAQECFQCSPWSLSRYRFNNIIINIFAPPFRKPEKPRRSHRHDVTERDKISQKKRARKT